MVLKHEIAGAAGTELIRPRPSRMPPALARLLHLGLKTAGFLATLAVTLLGLIFITFIIGRVMPLDPVLAVVGERASQDVYDAARLRMRLDEPLLVQFRLYLTDALQGNFGTSLLSGKPVLEDIASFFPATIELATAATLIGVSLGIPLGVIAATHHGRWQDHLIRIFALAGYSVPVFWLGLVGLMIFYAHLGWVAGPGRLDVAYQYTLPRVTGMALVDTLIDGNYDAFFNALAHLALPAFVLGYHSLAYITRMTRSFMLNELGHEYVTAARAKGMSEWRVVWRHALGNALVPLLTTVVLSYAYLLEGAVLTETVFAWPGIGLYITHSLFNADMPAVLGATMVIGVCFVALNLLSDLLYPLLDPRSR